MAQDGTTPNSTLWIKLEVCNWPMLLFRYSTFRISLMGITNTHAKGLIWDQLKESVVRARWSIQLLQVLLWVNGVC